jgi:Zn-finger nucleic acid-binding protein
MTPLETARSPMETRWPCPVCLGVAMRKTTVRGAGGEVTLDACPRCGGIWFERGEARQLARQQPEALWKEVPRRAEALRPPCHGCGAPLERDAERCPACGHGNVLRCPACDVEMERRAHGGLVLDLCRSCQGVWFDNAELSAIWRLNLAAATERASKRPGRGADALATGGDVLLNALFWTPDLVIYGASAATHAVGAAAQTLGSVASSGAAAEAATAAVDVVGEAAEGVFSMIADIIAGLFDG